MASAFHYFKRKSHGSGVEDDDVDSGQMAFNTAGKGLDRVVRTHIQLPDLNSGFGELEAKLGSSSFALLQRSYCNDEVRQLETQKLMCSFIAKASIG